MRKVLASALLAGLVGTLLVAGPALSKTKSVEVDDNYFVKKGAPRTVTVHKGDKVEWEWEGSNPHNVTVTKGPVKFHSKNMTSGTYEKKLQEGRDVQDRLHDPRAGHADDLEGREVGVSGRRPRGTRARRRRRSGRGRRPAARPGRTASPG